MDRSSDTVAARCSTRASRRDRRSGWNQAGSTRSQVARAPRTRGELSAAVREIGEELGAAVHVQRRLITVSYRTPAGAAKTVAYWSMRWVGGAFQACAEVERFPEIGRTLFERGPTLVYERLAAYLGRWVERGALRITIGHTSTDADVDALLAALPTAVARATTAGYADRAPVLGTR